MGSAWRRAKLALGLNMCVYVPATADEEDTAGRPSDAALLPPAMSTTPTPSSAGLRLSKSASRSSKVCVVAVEGSFSTFMFGFCENGGFCAVLVSEKEEKPS